MLLLSYRSARNDKDPKFDFQNTSYALALPRKPKKLQEELQAAQDKVKSGSSDVVRIVKEKVEQDKKAMQVLVDRLTDAEATRQAAVRSKKILLKDFGDKAAGQALEDLVFWTEIEPHDVQGLIRERTEAVRKILCQPIALKNNLSTVAIVALQDTEDSSLKKLSNAFAILNTDTNRNAVLCLLPWERDRNLGNDMWHLIRVSCSRVHDMHCGTYAGMHAHGARVDMHRSFSAQGRLRPLQDCQLKGEHDI